MWLDLATGNIAADRAESLLGHAALCTTCLLRLEESRDLIWGAVSAEEQSALTQFAPVTQDWQQNLAERLARTPHRRFQMPPVRVSIWAAGGLAAAIVVCAILWTGLLRSPERMLADAYAQNRAFELRIPGARFAELQSQTRVRGNGSGHESPSLLEARARIERRLESNRDDRHLLQLQARADVLEERYDAAIEILDPLLASGPVTASLLADDAMAYFLRGSVNGSENDRSTALDSLRRADELAPDDPVILFNEALVMEERGQVMNAVETWNRFLRIEHDPEWLAEGHRRLATLEDRLNRLKSHESRMQQHLATPVAMRALAEDATTLSEIDEELSTTFLPRILDAAFPLPVDRSRGSPCEEHCLAARTLLSALGASLVKNHQDPWLEDLLTENSLHNSEFPKAAHLLSLAIDANTNGNYTGAIDLGRQSARVFDGLKQPAGSARALAAAMYGLERSYNFAACRKIAPAVLDTHHSYRWVEAQAAALYAACDVNPGTAMADNPQFLHAIHLAEQSHYMLLLLRARNAFSSSSVESGDTETGWGLCVETLRIFYRGDYQPFRAATTVAGLAELEDATPRTQLNLLLHKEALQLFELAQNRAILAQERTALIRAALRAGAMRQAAEQARLVQADLTAAELRHEQTPWRAESEIAMAQLYADQGAPEKAQELLNAAQHYMRGQDNPVQLRAYAAVRGLLELRLGHPEQADSVLRSAIIREELEARGVGRQNVMFARQDRKLYAALAAVWLAQHRAPEEILALWERYRLRILGEPVPACARARLDCLATQVQAVALSRLNTDSGNQLWGQIVLGDRVLIYHVAGGRVQWSEAAFGERDLVEAAKWLEEATRSPEMPRASAEMAAKRLGQVLMAGLDQQGSPLGTLVLEPDPVLGNVPWPALATDHGALGLRFPLVESPSLLLHATDPRGNRHEAATTLAIGAAVGSGESEALPEALSEARMVANLGFASDLLLAQNATREQVLTRIPTASVIHFAGHSQEHNGETRLLLAPNQGNGGSAYLDRQAFLRTPPRQARLVVFSACATGKTEFGWDHGMGDIVDTLESLGVPQVVATRWQIDSASAVPLMSVFYQELSDGTSVARALMLARQSLARQSRYRHPYYWAAYYASGNGNPNLREVFHGTSN